MKKNTDAGHTQDGDAGPARKSDKDLYRALRQLSCGQLWTVEVPRFDRASPAERAQRVSLVRAVGVVFAEHGTLQQKKEAREWLLGLLQDPDEKIRRYAMTALPKIGAGAAVETGLLGLLRTTTVDREKKYLGQALAKIGGAATLDVVAGSGGLPGNAEQKVRATVARREEPSVIRLDRVFSGPERPRIHLRCRRGLEGILRDEVRDHVAKKGLFGILETRSGLVAITPLGPFSLSDIYALRCFGTAGFVLGSVGQQLPDESVEALAALITSPLSRAILKTFTEGSIRYRLEFVDRGHRRGAVRHVAERAYALCPEILNDSHTAPWAVDIHPADGGSVVELRPRISPDPRFSYREDDIPAASHPPLAACMARLAGSCAGEIVWDPFCGSGLELIERARLGGVQRLVGTDLSPEAIAVARANIASANLDAIPLTLACRDFRDFAAVEGLGPGSVTLMITNPPMGRRIRIPNLRGLFEDLFRVAAAALKPGGRLVFPNPLRIAPRQSSLALQYAQVVDLGGFDCRLEVHVKAAGDVRQSGDRRSRG